MALDAGPARNRAGGFGSLILNNLVRKQAPRLPSLASEEPRTQRDKTTGTMPPRLQVGKPESSEAVGSRVHGGIRTRLCARVRVCTPAHLSVHAHADLSRGASEQPCRLFALLATGLLTNPPASWQEDQWLLWLPPVLRTAWEVPSLSSEIFVKDPESPGGNSCPQACPQAAAHV